MHPQLTLQKISYLFAPPMAVTVYDVMVTAQSDYGWMLESAYPATLTFKLFANGTSLGTDFNTSITATGGTIRKQLVTVSGVWVLQCSNEAGCIPLTCMCSLHLSATYCPFTACCE